MCHVDVGGKSRLTMAANVASEANLENVKVPPNCYTSPAKFPRPSFETSSVWSVRLKAIPHSSFEPKKHRPLSTSCF